MAKYIDQNKLIREGWSLQRTYQKDAYTMAFEMKKPENFPTVDVRPVPPGGIGEMSDGYHTFNGLYYQRMVLFAALVNAYNDKAWKSWKHEDGESCFGGGWFIVGIDTPQGAYTYHYEDKYWNWFECKELPVAPHWDGHTEGDVTRLLSLPDVRPVVRGRWENMMPGVWGSIYAWCSACGETVTLDYTTPRNFCPNCGAYMSRSDDDHFADAGK